VGLNPIQDSRGKSSDYVVDGEAGGALLGLLSLGPGKRGGSIYFYSQGSTRGKRHGIYRKGVH